MGVGGEGAGDDEVEGEEVAEAAAEETEGGDEKERDEGESAGADAGVDERTHEAGPGDAQRTVEDVQTGGGEELVTVALREPRAGDGRGRCWR